MVSRFKSKLKSPLLFLSRPFFALDPNLISVLGAASSGLFFIFLVKKEHLLSLLAFGGNLLDAVDGVVARETKRVTAFGGFLDSTLDRIADSVIIVAFGFARLVRWEIICPLLIVSLLISYTRSRAESAGKGAVVLNIGLIERAERLILIFLALCAYMIFPDQTVEGFNLTELAFLLLISLSVVTILQRVCGAFAKLRGLK